MLNVGYARHNKDWNFRNVNSPFTRIYYVTSGEANVEIGGQVHHLVPGHMYLIPAFTEHTDICDGLFEHYYVHIYEDVASGYGIIENFDIPFEIEGIEMDVQLFRNLCEHNSFMALKHSNPKIYDNKHSLIECVRLNRERPLFDRLESMGIIYQMLGRFIKESKHKFQSTDPRIVKVLKILANNIGEQHKVEELACVACMSTDHFIRLFKHEVGCTPIQFVIEKRLMKAKLMLASENIPTKEIAYALGYDDVSYFTRLFRKHEGITPRQYRDSFNSNDESSPQI